MRKNVVAVIADLVGSRSVSDRAGLQRSLKKALKAASARNRSALISPYTLTLGDEFQAVYGKADRIFCDLLHIAAGIYPHRLRYALALGRLSTEINRKEALGMDGPAFHLARDGIEVLKKEHGTFYLAGSLGPFSGLANRALALVGHSMKDWQKNRFLVLLGMLEERHRKDIAAQIGISLTAFHKNIQAAALDEVVGLFHEIEKLLNSHLTK